MAATEDANADPLALSLDLLRRLPPSRITSNLDSLRRILPPDTLEDLLSSIDQPLRALVDTSAQGAHREFLVCDYNRDSHGEWRSHWSNLYFSDEPRSAASKQEGREGDEEQGTAPSEKLRKLELRANEAFDTYRQLYFEGGLSSVYLWDLDEGFAGVVLLKKDIGGQRLKGTWDSIHVFEANEVGGRSCRYKLTSTVMLRLRRERERGGGTTTTTKGGGASGVGGGNDDAGEFDLGGSLTRQLEADHALPDQQAHIANVGRMIEDVEGKMRSQLQEVYFGKTSDIVQAVRSEESLEAKRRERELQKELMGLWKR